MENTGGTITYDDGSFTVEKMLFTYSEEEMEENRINKAQAELVLKPKFIPIYPFMLQSGFSLMEATVFGFIDFFLGNNDRFYCTNEQLAEMLNSSVKTISLSIKNLKEKGLLDISYRVKANGGRIRFIQIPDFTKSNVATLQNVKSNFTKSKGIENKEIEIKKIKENKEKKGYGEFNKCLLTDKQYAKVIEDYGSKQGEYLIKQVDLYCARTGRQYKDYSAAIRTFADKEGIKKNDNKQENESGIYDLPF